jgi:hypothetical protein
MLLLQSWQRAIYSKHKPLELREQSITIGILRAPKDRLFSSFLDGWHHEGMDHNAWMTLKFRLKHLLFTEFRPALFAGNESVATDMLYQMVQEYMLHDHMIGCYTKMLNGYPCMSMFLTKSAPFNQTALDVALLRLRNFYFVGIFEDYNRSISTLHLLANNGRSRPHKVSFFRA